MKKPTQAQKARAARVAEHVTAEVVSGRSGHWDLSWWKYTAERAGDLDAFDGEPRLLSPFFHDVLRRTPGLPRLHRLNRTGKR